MVQRIAIAALATAFATPALAAPVVSLDTAIFVERNRDDQVRSLEPAQSLRRGERVVYVVTWYRLGGDGGFTITNPMPRTVAYQASARDDEQVSIDGGRSWGRLADLRVGDRTASPEDVTHVRWRITRPDAAQGRGRIAYSGIVR
jgi:hypothetical protein